MIDPTAVELDELLRRTTPEMAAAVRRSMPAGYRDQLDAAAHESQTMMETVEGKPVRHVVPSEVADWLRLGVLDTFLRWAKGEARMCEHRPTWRTPQAVWSAAWKPGLVVCTRCVSMLRADSVTEDRRCDCCGRICDVEAGDGIRTQTVWVGALAYQAGVCGDCYSLSRRRGLDTDDRGLLQSA